jgi:hypothetical protein
MKGKVFRVFEKIAVWAPLLVTAWQAAGSYTWKHYRDSRLPGAWKRALFRFCGAPEDQAVTERKNIDLYHSANPVWSAKVGLG